MRPKFCTVCCHATEKEFKQCSVCFNQEFFIPERYKMGTKILTIEGRIE